ncbi:MAG: hypothetical protein JF615_11535 [Asticcacaulis sp.]|nr:hypothetical protein [Asticcacaulis sp.]
MRRYAYAWITLAFFAISIVAHWIFGWFAYVNDAHDHHQAPEIMPWLVEMGRDTFENWQSEFLQLLWQVVGLAYFLYVGSPSSKEGDDRMEAKLDALLELVGRERGLELTREIDESHERRGGHAEMVKDPPYASANS